MSTSTQAASPRLLVAASGTGGHLFPAIATAEALRQEGYTIEWLGVPDRLETTLVPKNFPLHTVHMAGFQGRPGLGTVKTIGQFGQATVQVRRLLKQGNFDGVFTTGGYIAAPAIIAARSLDLPAVLHESNALPGKVTRWLSPWCTTVALGFEAARTYLPKAKTVVVGTPVRDEFLTPESPVLTDPAIPDGVPLVVVVGGSQGAVAVNQLVRAAAPAWIEAGAWIVHQTGSNDPEADSYSHPHYIRRPFFSAMAALMHRATLAIGRSGAGTLTELAISRTPSILIPYPFAAEDHQTVNAKAFVDAQAALMLNQGQIVASEFQALVLDLLAEPQRLDSMAAAAGRLAAADSATKLADLIQQVVLNR
ncbi:MULTISPECIES: undecaprenyldiphospho-muramoylpentapeptide beta-N-acetylglucosaminyltransferase [Cyanophyceae]|uniref:UDP-N-acetylglucosamine--N-acetylmuramyl-(pentapeptide) pyrophosphoryl-undecaprenol N-acetylglucosamine transferase n=1 Tax=Leptolyngbya subtilissima DQ-A4 TaxID=2933933 RepID=A0ABV0K0S5_9CYAN|nr:undecaprenyldiphospho-muramoylpentapeptide beta-N-acetylglucosaminyltransferase [Nodosilinea sp. FACHB-141]MBD2111147.1 undecaprenyldiphospho-muramoylpentapeptide beta-N-acetylglucosaminyltransferase [Nodosilinea sp. FACHB-141]